MVCESTLMTAPAQLSVCREGGVQISTSLVVDSPELAVSLLHGLKVATTILCAIMLVAVSPVPQMACETELIMPILRSQIKSNFITLDDCYVMTADGRIFFVKED